MLLKRKNSPYWYAVLWLNGRRRWLSLKCADKHDAKLLHDEIKKRCQDQQRINRIAMLLGEKPKHKKTLLLSQAWNKYVQVNKTYSKGARKIFSSFEKYIGNDCDISEIDTDRALQFLDRYKHKAGKTYNTYKSALSKIWRTLLPYTDIEKNIFGIIPSRPAEGAHYRPLTNEELNRLFAAAPSQFWKDFLLVLLHTGMRRKDAMLLKWEHIKDDYIEIVPHKTAKLGKSVYIPIHPAVKEILTSRKAIATRTAAASQYVFPECAHRTNSGSFQNKTQKLFNIAGIRGDRREHLGLPSLRSTFVTRCEEAGIPRHVIMGIVGHSSPQMTAHYSHDRQTSKGITAISFIK